MTYEEIVKEAREILAHLDESDVLMLSAILLMERIVRENDAPKEGE